MSPRPRLLALALALALPLTLAGCLGGSSEPPPEPPPSPAQVAPSPGTPAGKSVTVRMENIQYMPKEVRVVAGGTVTWENTDAPPHTVTKESGPGKSFDSGTMQPGDEYKQRFSQPGRVEYLCEIHPGQTGTVSVE